MRATLPLLIQSDFPAIRRKRIETLQVNLGYRCNQSCLHCHVNAGPTRTEMLNGETADLIFEAMARRRITTLDLTGGAPELNPHFRHLIASARSLGAKVIDRCNLTVLWEPGQEDLAEFLAASRVEIVASLPCYSRDNVDRQRGDGVFVKSISALQRLNALGYGRPGSELVLNLVFNPQGPTLPPDQIQLEVDYKKELHEQFGISFNTLFVIANMPIQRFGSTLLSKGQFHDYMQLLRDAYRAENLDSVMCRTMVSVDWQGYLYDCDFNQMLNLSSKCNSAARPHLRDLLAHDVAGEQIVVADHCFGCTAGQGSSCGGALGAPSEAGAAARQ